MFKTPEAIFFVIYALTLVISVTGILIASPGVVKVIQNIDTTRTEWKALFHKTIFGSIILPVCVIVLALVGAYQWSTGATTINLLPVATFAVQFALYPLTLLWGAILMVGLILRRKAVASLG